VYIFVRLFLAHLLADLPFQSDSLFKMKTKSILGIALHSLIFMICAVFLSIPYLGQGMMWWYIIFLGLGHLVIDKVKLWLNEEGWKNKSVFLLDQFIHIFWIGLVSYWGNIALEPVALRNTGLGKIYDNDFLILVIIAGILVLYRKIISKQLVENS
jgi:hypothetical protein